MRVWLIGNRGMLGSEVEKFLAGAGIDHFSTDLEINITKIAALRQFVTENPGQIDCIINCSGYTAVDKAENERELAFAINANGVKNIAQVALELDAYIIHISTDYVFDGEKTDAYVEDDPPAPNGVYAESKLKGEELLGQNLKEHYILRTAWLYGNQGGNFVSTMLRLFSERDTVKVVSDQWGSPTFARDLASVILTILRDTGENYGIYHFTNEGKTNWCDFAREIYGLARARGLVNREVEIVPLTTEQYPTPARRPSNSVLSNEKVKNTFGITIRSWQNALEDYLDDLKESM